MIFFGRDECDFSRCLSIRSADFIQWPSVRGLSPLCSSEQIRLVRLLTTFHEPQASESKRWSIFTMNKRGRSKCSLCREEELTANGVGFLFEVMKFLKLTGCGCALPVNKLRTAELYTWDGWTVWCEFHLNKAVFKKWRESRKEKATYSTSKMKGILDSHQALFLPFRRGHCHLHPEWRGKRQWSSRICQPPYSSLVISPPCFRILRLPPSQGLTLSVISSHNQLPSYLTARNSILNMI